MGDYNRDRSGGRRFGGSGRSGGGRFGGRGGGGEFRRDSGQREMHNAVCDSCGKDCQVPFRPTGGKPVFCSDCFEKQNGGSDRPRRESSFQRRDNSTKKIEEQISALGVKLDKIISLLEVSEPKPKVKKETVKKIAVKKEVTS